MTGSSAAPLEGPPPGTYRIEPDRSVVHYSGQHLFGLGTVRATFGVKSGEVLVADPVDSSRATVTVDAGSFASGNARRDADVRGAKLLDVETYPDITFSSDRVDATGAGWQVSGTVTTHGHSIPVTVAVDGVTAESSGYRVHGRAAHVDRTALGVTGSRGMVGRHLDLELDVFLERT